MPGPKGGRFTVLVATPAWAVRAAGLWATEGWASQRVFSGAVNTADMRHDVAVYRAACAAYARIEAAAARRRAAAELDLPMARGKVLFPDAQIEDVTAAGAGRRCNVEVASEHYGGGDIHAKGTDAPICQDKRLGCLRDVSAHAEVCHNTLVDFTGEEAFEAADDLASGPAASRPAGDVVDRRLVEPHADDDRAMEGACAVRCW